MRSRSRLCWMICTPRSLPDRASADRSDLAESDVRDESTDERDVRHRHTFACSVFDRVRREDVGLDAIQLVTCFKVRKASQSLMQETSIVQATNTGIYLSNDACM